jgi:sugar O-acyltransferase (sialic acid O-acetyltransferase NeuD family)
MADIVIFGAGMAAEIAKVYLEAHTGHRVVGFTVDAQYLRSDDFCGLPVVAWEELERSFPPEAVELLGPISYRRLNEFRRDRYREGKARHYRYASFIHPSCQNYATEIGEHCFILEATVIQPFTVIGDNVVIWGGVYVGHHCRLADHCFVSAQAGVGGGTRIGERCFVGGQVGIIPGVEIGAGSLLSAGVRIVGDIPAGSVVTRNGEDRITAVPSSRMRRLL